MKIIEITNEYNINDDYMYLTVLIMILYQKKLYYSLI